LGRIGGNLGTVILSLQAIIHKNFFVRQRLLEKSTTLRILCIIFERDLSLLFEIDRVPARIKDPASWDVRSVRDGLIFDVAIDARSRIALLVRVICALLRVDSEELHRDARRIADTSNENRVSDGGPAAAGKL
jgi:hypothetical protein